MTTIPRDRFELYEAAILSGQVPAADVIALMNDNPEFAEWYRKRAAIRRGENRQ